DQLTNIEMGFMQKFTNIAMQAYGFKASIPVEFFASNDELQDKLYNIVLTYIRYCYAITNRMHILGESFANVTLRGQEENVEKFCRGLSESRKSKIHFSMADEMKKNDEVNSKPSGGCYIATCVYGSYDCPQVWTLRRFRDYILSKSWYGRCFIRSYYTISPTLVKLLGNKVWFKRIWKAILDMFILRLNNKGIK